jgi:two-component system phosphate regulon sensor histidine kinase PhoR
LPAAIQGIAAGVCCGIALARRGAAAPLPAPPATEDEDPSRARLDAVLASVTEGVLIVDREGIVLAASPVATSLLRLSWHAERQPRLSTLVPWPQLELAVQECLADGQPQRFEGAPPSASHLTLDVRITGWHCDGERKGVVVVIDDQSLLRQLEAHRRDFVANVSHELKTPLAAIQGFVETMIEDPDMPTPTQRRFLERVAVQTERLSTLVGDLLTLSRLDEDVLGSSGKEAIEIRALVHNVLHALQPLAERKPVSVADRLPAIDIHVAGEREALRQVFSNLIDNAIKYTPAGGSVVVELRRENGHVDFVVTDTGIGLSPEDQERVFERFYRVDKARSRELGGTGLGLSIVKNTVRTLGGTVGVRSELGKGSTFWVRLPVVAAH